MWKRLTLQPIFAGCPNRCRHCCDAAGPPFGAFMSADDIRWLADGFREASAKAMGEALDILVWEDGYESTAHPEFVEMLRCIRTFEYEPGESLSSNGYGIARLDDWRGALMELREMGFTGLASAIHGVGDQHDRFVRRRGAYHDLEVSARRFLDAGMNVFFEIHLNRGNVGEFAAIIEALQELTDGRARLTSGIDAYYMNDTLRELESVRLRARETDTSDEVWELAPDRGHDTEAALTERLSEEATVQALDTYSPTGRGPEARRLGTLIVEPSFDVIEVFTARPAAAHGNVKEDGFDAVFGSVLALELPPMPEPGELAERYGDTSSDLLYPGADSVHMKLASRYWSEVG